MAIVKAQSHEALRSGINLSVDFFNPASENDTVLVKTELIKLGRTVINFNAVVINQNNGKLVAKASSSLAVSSIKFTF